VVDRWLDYRKRLPERLLLCISNIKENKMFKWIKNLFATEKECFAIGWLEKEQKWVVEYRNDDPENKAIAEELLKLLEVEKIRPEYLEHMLGVTKYNSLEELINMFKGDSNARIRD
jgi:hypothetical protein